MRDDNDRQFSRFRLSLDRDDYREPFQQRQTDDDDRSGIWLTSRKLRSTVGAAVMGDTERDRLDFGVGMYISPWGSTDRAERKGEERMTTLFSIASQSIIRRSYTLVLSSGEIREESRVETWKKESDRGGFISDTAFLYLLCNIYGIQPLVYMRVKINRRRARIELLES